MCTVGTFYDLYNIYLINDIQTFTAQYRTLSIDDSVIWIYKNCI